MTGRKYSFDLSRQSPGERHVECLHFRLRALQCNSLIHFCQYTVNFVLHECLCDALSLVTIQITVSLCVILSTRDYYLISLSNTSCQLTSLHSSLSSVTRLLTLFQLYASTFLIFWIICGSFRLQKMYHPVFVRITGLQPKVEKHVNQFSCRTHLRL